MRSPEFLRNGDPAATPSPRTSRGGAATRQAGPGFQSTAAAQKIRRFGKLVLLFRVASFCFVLASTVFMVMNTHGNSAGAAGTDGNSSGGSIWSADWFDYDAFRYIVVVGGIISIYSFLQMGAALWEIIQGSTPMPEIMQVWFDFSHDQAFAYLLFSANSAACVLSQSLVLGQPCSTGVGAFCVQSYISIALGFTGFLFVAASALASGFRVACFVITGSRFHV